MSSVAAKDTFHCSLVIYHWAMSKFLQPTHSLVLSTMTSQENFV